MIPLKSRCDSNKKRRAGREDAFIPPERTLRPKMLIFSGLLGATGLGIFPRRGAFTSHYRPGWETTLGSRAGERTLVVNVTLRNVCIA